MHSLPIFSKYFFEFIIHPTTQPMSTFVFIIFPPFHQIHENLQKSSTPTHVNILRMRAKTKQNITLSLILGCAGLAIITVHKPVLYPTEKDIERNRMYHAQNQQAIERVKQLRNPNVMRSKVYENETSEK